MEGPGGGREGSSWICWAAGPCGFANRNLREILSEEKKSSVIILDNGRVEKRRVKELEYEQAIAGLSSGQRGAWESKGRSTLLGQVSVSGIFKVIGGGIIIYWSSNNLARYVVNDIHRSMLLA